jgi:hypothetical protein
MISIGVDIDSLQAAFGEHISHASGEAVGGAGGGYDAKY